MDLDECMVYSFFSSEKDKESGSKKRKDIETVSLRCINQSRDEFQMRLRPGLREYLREVASFADVFAFTAGTYVYAQSALQHIDRDNDIFKQRWYRESCLNIKNTLYLKDLSRVFGKDYLPHRTVLVDNNIVSFIPQPNNGVLVKNFYDDEYDNSLLNEVLPKLILLDKESDVRPFLRNSEKLEEVCKQLEDRIYSALDVRKGGS